MRLLMKVSIPGLEGNAAVLDGTIGSTIGSILADLKPEAVYFSDCLYFSQYRKRIADSGNCRALVSRLQRRS
jgi:hypothetical protein